ncbi:maleylpyruvate isomerase N-terminal domain-containing protein [Microlunatus capsulatus]|uniref:Uncharacterized protein (TIGR03083 family) n=1 Tax=Microlunatus capsulatus TaxID=99117 RepID=A0ABS4Z4C0_9ACTN|nr:maleylpyruvate isomerase N-terminal domain-containing protein [Microlunatus capsulatus]MBP2415898.1 uncharacterized protein (TIGR03083 family) [Microlunatus capsulatus]
MHTWEDERRAFSDAADWFAGLTARVGDRWEEPGLGEWDVRSLVGHTGRALLTVETYLARPAPPALEVPSAPAYYAAARRLVGGPEVTERGRAAGRDLGEDPVAAVAALVARVPALLKDRDGSELVPTVVGAMRLRDYLPTRVLELAVHGSDLAAALGVPAEVPPRAAASSLHLLADLAVADGRSATLLRSLTGRTALPAGTTLL